MSEEIKAIFTYEKFSKIENGYTVNLGKVVDTQEKVTLVGFYIPKIKKVTFKYYGKWESHPQHGKQFIVESFEEVAESESEIIAYLASGIIKGIGQKTAERIYAEFGQRSLTIIEKDPEQLLKIKGITEKKLSLITKSFSDSILMQNIARYLLPFGISQNITRKVFEKFGSNALSILKSNPYRLCEIKGITFVTADRVGLKENIFAGDPNRIEKCIEYVIEQYEQKGHTCVEQNELGKAVMKALNSSMVNAKMIEENTIRMIKEKKLTYKTLYFEINGIKQRNVFIALSTTYEKESEIAQDIVRLKYEPKKEIPNIDALINEAEEHFRINLSPEQKKAVKEALCNPCTVITGGPGTGKTTIIKVISYIYKKLNKFNAMTFMAPTGRAARRITETTGYSASTIHSKMKINCGFTSDYEEYDEELEIYSSLVVIDETSMADIFIMHKLMKNIRKGCTTILVGDVNQLPSVGAGALLRDVINSTVVPVIRLKQIFRQAESSNIILNADKIVKGDSNLCMGEDFKIHEETDLECIQTLMAQDYKKSIELYGVENVICLCPYKEGFAGVFEMNKLLQKMINPKDKKKNEINYSGYTFRENDIVMHHMTNEECISNGDIGIVTGIEIIEDEINVTVAFLHGVTEIYTKDTLENLTLAYALTVHKSQGAEYKKVITCLTEAHGPMLKRNFPYTGFTRAKEEVSFYGTRKALKRAIENNAVDIRNTMLEYHMRVYDGQFMAA